MLMAKKNVELPWLLIATFDDTIRIFLRPSWRLRGSTHRFFSGHLTSQIVLNISPRGFWAN